MSEFRVNLCALLGQGSQLGASRLLAFTPLRAQQQQAAMGPFAAQGKKVVGEKRKRHADDSTQASPHPVYLSSFMVALRVTASRGRSHAEVEGGSATSGAARSRG